MAATGLLYEEVKERKRERERDWRIELRSCARWTGAKFESIKLDDGLGWCTRTVPSYDKRNINGFLAACARHDLKQLE